jgi:hypothetical protein
LDVIGFFSNDELFLELEDSFLPSQRAPALQRIDAVESESETESAGEAREEMEMTATELTRSARHRVNNYTVNDARLHRLRLPSLSEMSKQIGQHAWSVRSRFDAQSEGIVVDVADAEPGIRDVADNRFGVFPRQRREAHRAGANG